MKKNMSVARTELAVFVGRWRTNNQIEYMSAVRESTPVLNERGVVVLPQSS